MGWVWMCVGIRNKSARRIGRRVSSDTYDSRLAHQYDFTKTPRIEDFLDPRAAGYDAFVNSNAPLSPTSSKEASSLGRNADENWERDSRARALDGNDRSHKGTHEFRHSASNERIRNNYGLYWDNTDDLPEISLGSIDFPRITPPTRKSASKHLIDVDEPSNGPLALAAMPAVAKSAARTQEPSSLPGLLSKEVQTTERSRNVALKLAMTTNCKDSGMEWVELQSGAGGTNSYPIHLEPHELLPAPETARSQRPHSAPLLDLSEDHIKASKAVIAFKESRRESGVADFTPMDQPAPKPSYIGSLFSSSRKWSLQPGSRLSQAPLSTVAESLFQTEEPRAKRNSDVTFHSSINSNLPQGRRGSHDGVCSSNPVPDNQQQETPGGLSVNWSGTEALDTELATRDVSEFLSTEEWDDCVLVEKVEELPTQRGQTRHEPLEVESNSGSCIEVASGQRDENVSGNQGRGRDLSPAKGATSSIDGRILDQGSDSSTSSSEVGSRDEAASASPKVETFGRKESGSVRRKPIKIVVSQCEGRKENDTVMGTPVRNILVSPEVFVSPKPTTSELNFMRVMDMNPEERPIFGSLADHWEAAWATKRPAWDGKGIPNSTHKYREDQKVMWHATSFEERLAQALASQEAVPQRYKFFPIDRMS